MVTELQKETFDKEVLKTEGLVLVDFYATWCGPCQMLAPIIDAHAEEYPSVKVCRLDVDDAMEIAARYGIASIPTLIYFRAGKAVKTGVGLLTPDGLKRMTEALL